MIAFVDLPIPLKLLIAWLLVSLVLGWSLSRWFRWMRGDFDQDP